MTDTKADLGSIDASIEEVKQHSEHHRRSSQRLITYLMTFSAALLFFQVFLFVGFPSVDITVPDPLMYGLFAIYVMVFGVLMAIYRFHLNEISRAEHFIIGFMRIRVAANNAGDEGFQSEVRTSLTEGAFSHHTVQQKGIVRKQVESPIPGHPTSDVTSILLNKLLEGFEVKRKS